MVKQIIVHLLDGRATGAKKLVFGRGSDVAAVVIERKDSAKHSQLNELKQHNLYLLIDTENKQIYVGQTKGFDKRSQAHKSRSRLKWDLATVLSKNSDQSKYEFEKSHVAYFEFLAYSRLKKLEESGSSRYQLINDQPVSETYIMPARKAELQEDFLSFIDLLAIVGICPFSARGSIEVAGQPVQPSAKPHPKNRSTSEMSFLDAAYKVLSDANKPLHYKEILQLALDSELLKTKGKTPDATMSARLSVDSKGSDSRFNAMGRGYYGLTISVLQNVSNKTDRDAVVDHAFDCAKCKKTKPLIIRHSPPKISYTANGQRISTHSEDNYIKRKHVGSSGKKNQLYYCKECAGPNADIEKKIINNSQEFKAPSWDLPK